MIIGFVLATVLQILQKYTKLKSFFNVKLFLVLAILLIMAWMLSLSGTFKGY
jgi:predicted nucleic acid-binding Zn ribbon protein